MNLILKNVNKTYGKKTVLNDINMQTDEGEIIGLIGPNGAGKTTLMKVICGLTGITSGTVILYENKFENRKVDTAGKVGCLIENPTAYDWMSGYENLKLYSDMHKTGKDYLEHVIEFTGLQDDIHRKFKNYSLGMKQRLGLGLALIGKPSLLILDEPMNGLDVDGVSAMRKMLLKLAKEDGITILVSSHILSEMDKICDSAVFLKKGRIIATSTREELMGEGFEERYNELMSGGTIR